MRASGFNIAENGTGCMDGLYPGKKKNDNLTEQALTFFFLSFLNNFSAAWIIGFSRGLITKAMPSWKTEVYAAIHCQMQPLK